nr:hypothetical protein [Stutzerimonas azotifigens]
MIIAVAGCVSGLLAPAQASPLENAQIYANRATSSFLLYRGEGFQQAHLTRLEQDIGQLDAAVQSLATASPDLRLKHQELVALLREGAAFGHTEDDVPWGWPSKLAKSLRDFLTASREQQGGDTQAELPAKVEYLAVQYLSRAYIGSFETAREQPDTYLGQDERKLVPAIDEQIRQLEIDGDPLIAKLKARWDFLKSALTDMNSGSNGFNSASGRPFAPIMVDRHTRGLSDQWMARAQ